MNKINIKLLNKKLIEYNLTNELPEISYNGYWDDEFETRLAKIFITWKKTNSLPVIDSNNISLKNNTKFIIKELKEMDIKKLNIYNLNIEQIFILIGIQKTIGSIYLKPPLKNICEQSFNAKYKNSSNLTKGARELSKHMGRCSSKWWGEIISGTEIQKNNNANVILKYLLDNSIWFAIFKLTSSIIIFEIREKDGYGARWDISGNPFRGFVEPHMENGHEKKWKH